MLEFWVVGGFFFLWFWLSLHPWSRLGIAVTGADFMSLFRDLHRKELQSRQRLRTAGQKALAIYSSLCLVGMIPGAVGKSETFTRVLPGALGGLCGIVLAYVLLHWSTRPGGWYGLE